MNKIKFNVSICELNYIFFIKEEYNDSKLFRYAKAAIKKKGIDLLKICKDKFLDSIDKCPFCDKDSKYEIDFNIDRSNNIINIIGLYLVENKIGWKNYHCKSGRGSCLGSLLNPNSIEYVSKSFKVDVDMANNFILDRNKSPFYKNNHKSEDEYRIFQSRSKESYINKYGDAEGNIKYNSFLNKIREKNNRELLIEKYGIEGYRNICDKKSVCTLSFYISKYGEDLGIIKYQERIEKNKKIREGFIKKYGEEKWNESVDARLYKTSLEYFIQTLGYEKGTKKFDDLRRSYSFTKIDYIEKYGEEMWIRRGSVGKKSYSKESVIFFELFIDSIKKIGIIPDNIKWKDNEFFLWDNEYNRIYFYDLYFEYNDKKIIIEYDNIFWHPKKDVNPLNNGVVLFNDLLSLDEKIEYDERKNNIVIFKGYNLIKVETDQTNLVRDQWKYLPLLEKLINDIKIIVC